MTCPKRFSQLGFWNIHLTAVFVLQYCIHRCGSFGTRDAETYQMLQKNQTSNVTQKESLKILTVKNLN